MNYEATKPKVKVVQQPNGKWAVYVGGFQRMVKATQKGAEGYAKRILDAN